MATATANFSLVLLLLLHSTSLASSLNISLGSTLFAAPAQNQSSYWLSPSGNFAFGFYPLTRDARSFVVGIWLVETTNKTLVWVANRDDPPLPARGTSLLLTQTGKLIVQSQSREKLISNATSAATQASMLDTGNFVLYNSVSEIIWESFNLSTHTILAGQTLKSEQELFSLASETSTATGRFRLSMKSSGNLALYRTNPVRDEADKYWERNSSDPGAVLHLDSNGRLIIRPKDCRCTPEVLNHGDNTTIGFYIYRATIDTDGNFRLYAHSLEKKNAMNVSSVWSAMDNLCEVKGICGDNSYCDLEDLHFPTCLCPPGFTSNGTSNQLFQNCATSLRNEDCKSGSNSTKTHAHMVTLENIEWDDVDYKNAQTSEEKCRIACEDDCDCIFAVFKNYQCALLMMNQTLKYGRISYRNETLRGFFKVDSWENTSPTSSPFGRSLPPQQRNRPPKKLFLVTVILASILLAYVAFSGFWILVVRSRIKRYKEFSAYTIKNEVSLRSFTYRDLCQATGWFGVELGRGSFGTVYGGTLFGDVKIAVKKLDKVVEEGEKQFQAEMNIIGRTHHKNLVRLLGYCKEDSHRLLVYEFMPNGSLADLVFKEEGRLQWGERVRISLGIARGLRYLHEECETQIIHCDIKPSNILLSDSWVPKISDFGLSKLLEPDQTRTFTGARGTRGYVAPEWSRNVPITTRVDVYSFGVMLLEIICCRKSLMLNVPANQISLCDWAYECLASGKLEKLVAPEDVENVDERLERMVMVGLWCIQEEPSLRPTMKIAVLMLEGTMEVLVPPHPSHGTSTVEKGTY